MKIIEGFKLRNIGNEVIVVGEGVKQVNFNKLVSLNSTAAYLWGEIEGKEFTTETLAQLLVQKYEVEYDLAFTDSKNIVASWLEVGIIEE